MYRFFYNVVRKVAFWYNNNGGDYMEISINRIIEEAKASLMFEDMIVTDEEIKNGIAIAKGETTAEIEIQKAISKYRGLSDV